MALNLYYHPLSSSCWKVLIALDEMGIAFEPRFLDLADTGEREMFLALWPTGKIPLLVDGTRVVPETSIIVEYLSRHYAEPDRSLLPREPDANLEVRLMDRVLDLYAMTPMQVVVADRLRANHERDPIAVAKARETLAMVYGLLERRLDDRPWMAGERFSLADCTAAPALFYAATIVPLPATCHRLGGYYERLLQRPSVARVLEEARPYFQFYPFREALPARFLPAAGG
ncbi:glutathione S-transferase family protein [Ramlibacter tataouinensis]|uniref:Glutathione S-transferase (Glutathione transferase)-like protein n=1 Tax=Ramlibacter tataouinensis (strain ATCC BAA-407 / DSM 14655 / LMG 21543 / TTB310) TaxID=365046 RepID=F5XZ76_RAMTT|nr:glutathione S-transferase family protein [Ramlibacter tataouinensis]AEG93246.1 glutathione S-transferase (Glutathione transferase)-like protein [Ramlibacter tataouinensis TTB310]